MSSLNTVEVSERSQSFYIVSVFICISSLQAIKVDKIVSKKNCSRKIGKIAHLQNETPAKVTSHTALERLIHSHCSSS